MSLPRYKNKRSLNQEIENFPTEKKIQRQRLKAKREISAYDALKTIF